MMQVSRTNDLERPYSDLEVVPADHGHPQSPPQRFSRPPRYIGAEPSQLPIAVENESEDVTSPPHSSSRSGDSPCVRISPVTADGSTNGTITRMYLEQQPTLEVLETDGEGQKEVATQLTSIKPDEDVRGLPRPSKDEEDLSTPYKKSRRWQQRRRTKWGIIFAVVLVAAVVGGVTGGVLSNRGGAGDDRNDNTGSTSTSSDADTGTSGGTVPFAPDTMTGSATALSAYTHPTAVSWGYPHLEVFSLGGGLSPQWTYRSIGGGGSDDDDDDDDDDGDDNDVIWLPDDGDDNSFTSLGGSIASFQKGISVVARSNTHVDIFVASSSGSLLHKYHDAAMNWAPNLGDWTEIVDSTGIILASPPTAASWAASRMDVFAIGLDSKLHQKTWGGEAWADWTTMDSNDDNVSWNAAYAPTVVSRGADRYDVFVVGSQDSAVYTYSYRNGRTPLLLKLGGYSTSRPAATSRGVDLIDLFVRGGDAGLWHLSYSAQNLWSNWTSISTSNNNSTSGVTTAAIKGEPEVTSWGPNNLDVFVWGEGSDGALLHKRFNGESGTWTPPEGSGGFNLLGRGLTGPPKAVSDREQGVHVFAYLGGDRADDVGMISWNPTRNSWESDEDFEDVSV